MTPNTVLVKIPASVALRYVAYRRKPRLASPAYSDADTTHPR
jgi:hypothetical protein